MTTEEQFKAWVDSLSLLDQQLLKDHALDSSPPDKVTDLLKYGPVAYPGWFETKPPTYFYPQPLLRALGVDSGA
ncbi:MAG TPA: hypothetical protein VMT88_14435 [Actinomycetes bacterium]|nr:hypothetical protein [Actinomycetes bacterium]